VKRLSEEELWTLMAACVKVAPDLGVALRPVFRELHVLRDLERAVRGGLSKMSRTPAIWDALNSLPELPEVPPA